MENWRIISPPLTSVFGQGFFFSHLIIFLSLFIGRYALFGVFFMLLYMFIFLILE
uniref:Uncharacterized protein n=1 Tax=Octopus bimaculoides TaxID=37653 RepID=A0A0L8FJM1_OCTBM